MSLTYEQMVNLCVNGGGSPLSWIDIDKDTLVQAMDMKTGARTKIWTSDEANAFQPLYTATLNNSIELRNTIVNLLPKTTYMEKGDSIRLISAKETGGGGQISIVAEGTDTFGTSDEPTISVIDNVPLSILANPFDETLNSALKTDWQSPTKRAALTWDEKIAHHMDAFIDGLDQKLCSNGDTAFVTGDCESLDRIITNTTEVDSGTFWNVSTDGDRWGLSATNPGGDWRDAQIDLPATAVIRSLTLDMIDDVVADMVKYGKSDNRNIIALTRPKQHTRLNNLIEPKVTIPNPVRVTTGLNGVQTVPGHEYGFEVSSYISNGIKIPIFDSWSVHYETGGYGNVYLINTSTTSLRMAMPPSTFMTTIDQMALLNKSRRQGMHLFAGQLFCDSFPSNGAVKYV